MGVGVGAIGEEQIAGRSPGQQGKPPPHPPADVRRAQVPVHDPRHADGGALQPVRRPRRAPARGQARRDSRLRLKRSSAKTAPRDPRRSGVQDGDQARVPQAHQQGQGAPGAPLLPADPRVPAAGEPGPPTVTGPGRSRPPRPPQPRNVSTRYRQADILFELPDLLS